MKKIMSLLLVAVLVLSMAACGNNPDTPSTGDTTPSTEPSTEATEPSTEATEPSTEESDPATEKAMDMLIIALGESYDNYTSVTVMNDGTGCYIDFSGEVRKVTTLDMSALADIEAAVNGTGLLADGSVYSYGEGTNMAAVSVIYDDWSSVDVDYSGSEVPENVTAGINTIIAYIETLLADVPEYVPQAAVYGDVNADILAELEPMVNGTGMEGLEYMFIQEIPVDDEYFAYSAGLSSAEGISASAYCTSMMMTTAYSLVIVSVEDAANVASVAADFEASLDWHKWICVQPSNALIAQKGNMVLCLIGTDSMYTDTVAAITDAGWTTVSELTNPDM